MDMFALMGLTDEAREAMRKLAAESIESLDVEHLEQLHKACAPASMFLPKTLEHVVKKGIDPVHAVWYLAAMLERSAQNIRDSFGSEGVDLAVADIIKREEDMVTAAAQASVDLGLDNTGN